MDENKIRANANSTCPAMEKRNGKLRCPICGAEGVIGQNIQHKDGCKLGEAIEDALSMLDKGPKDMAKAIQVSLASIPVETRIRADALVNVILCADTLPKRQEAIDAMAKACPGIDRRLIESMRSQPITPKQTQVIRMMAMFELGIQDKERMLLERMKQLKGNVTSALK